MTEIINGYPCRTCTDVELAKKHINPAKPEDGPFGEDAKAKAARGDDLRPGDPAVLLSGALAGLDKALDGLDRPREAPQFPRLDLRV